jgi:hypothetical protein
MTAPTLVIPRNPSLITSPFILAKEPTISPPSSPSSINLNDDGAKCTQSQHDSGYEEEFDPESLVGTIIKASSKTVSTPASVYPHSQPSTYRLAQFIGAGSYALVYAAEPTSDSTLSDDHDQQSHRQQYPPIVAVKCLSKQNLSTDQLLIQKRESDLLKYLSGHAGIISLLWVSESEDYLFMAMDMCDEDLFDVVLSGRVNASGPFYDYHDEIEMAATVKDVFEQICSAVAHCHAKGVYHRDLKVCTSIATFY